MFDDTGRPVGCGGAGYPGNAGAQPGFMPQIEEIIHGTTLVINAIIERKGAKTGLITTRGFRDVLELGREIRYDAYDIFAEYPLPLSTPIAAHEVTERVTSDGRVIKALDGSEVQKVLAEIAGYGDRIFSGVSD